MLERDIPILAVPTPSNLNFSGLVSHTGTREQAREISRVDFIRIIRSLEELLFELMTWLIFYPRTVWLILRRPLSMMAYSEHEQADNPEDRYTGTLSPPLLLLVTLLLVHGLEIAAGADPLPTDTRLERLIAASDQNLLFFRSVLFGVLPLFAALSFVTAAGLPLVRESLRAPFFGHCYLAAVYALLLALPSLVAQAVGPTAAALATSFAVYVAATVWYLAVQARHFRSSLPIGEWRALGLSLLAFLMAVACAAALLVVIAVGA